MSKSDRMSYDDNVRWLRQHVPMDDVYEFAEQTIMCAEYFLANLNGVMDLGSKMQNDKIFAGWVKNLVGIRAIKEQNINISIKTRFKEP
jgi:hypothetical protein